MLSSAVRTYVRRYAVLPGDRTVICTCNDDAYLTALAIHEAGGQVAAVIDSRTPAAADNEIVRQVSALVPVHFDAKPIKAIGETVVRGVDVDLAGARMRLACDLLAVSGGFTPVVHLHMQAGGGLTLDPASGGFIPADPRQNQISAGAAAGRDGLGEHLADGWAVGEQSAVLAGFDQDPGPAPHGAPLAPEASGAGTAWDPGAGAHLKTAFVDYQNDVTAADLDLAWREG
jgi:sarcosine oxidase subunit alpha